MADEEPVPKPPSREGTFFKQVSIFQWFLIAVIIFAPWYMVNITTQVPNLINTTNGTYNVLYAPQDLVPQSYIDPTYAMVLNGAVVGLVFLFLMHQQKETGKITEREGKEILSRELKKKQTIPLPDGTIEMENLEIEDILPVIPRYYTVKGERKLFRYVYGIVLKDKTTDMPYYFRAYIDPYDRTLDGIVPTNRDLVDVDMCSRCGKEFSFKTLYSDDLMRMKKAEKLFKEK